MLVCLAVLDPVLAHAEIPVGLAMVIPRGELRDFAKRAETEYVNPVKENLFAYYGKDVRLIALLDQIQIRLPLVLQEPAPNARAKREGGARQLEVDLDLLAELNHLADTAAILRMSDPALLQHLAGATREFRSRLQGAKSDALPPFPFVVRRDVPDPETRAMAQHLALGSFLSAVSWVVLHEIAHHYLCHLEPTPCGSKEPWSLSERAQEEQADRWAFEKMYEMGYSLLGVRSMLAAEATIMRLRNETLKPPPVESGTHPTILQRVAMIDRLLTALPAQRHPIRWFAVIVENPGDPAQVRVQEFAVPIRPDEDGYVVAASPEGGDRPLLGVARVQSTIRLYGRDETHFSEVIFSEIDAPVARVTFRHRRRSDGRLFGVQRPAYHVDWATFQHLKVGNVAVRDVLGSSPIDLLRNALLAASVPSAGRAGIEREYLSALSTMRQTFVDYARGTTGSSEAAKALQSAGERASAMLKERLGARYETVVTAHFGDPVMGEGLDRLHRLLARFPPSQ
ncbi:MAG TPA: hypothetical protein VFO67_19875 [Gemmatimonadales bacterium]|nr:hypothetical protein [Gemmatimonadales bacterium]